MSAKESYKRWNNLIVLSIGGGIIIGLLLNVWYTHNSAPVMYQVAEAYDHPIEPEEEVILIEAHINWTPERIEQEIRETFPETQNTAVAVAKCESGLRADAVGPTNDRGIMQIHEPSWHAVAVRLGYADYATDVADNLSMARYIYERNGWNAWVCYSHGYYKKYL